MQRLWLTILAGLLSALPCVLFSQTPHWESLDGPCYPESRTHLRYADGDRRYYGSNTGTFKTTDGGRTWKNVGLPLASDFAISQSPDGKLLALRGYWQQWDHIETYELYSSTDRGEHWTLSWQNHMWWYGLAYGGADTVYDSYGVYDWVYGNGTSYLGRSTDAGVTWSPILSISDTRGKPFSEVYTQPNNIFARRSGEGWGYEVHRSTDGGTTWQKIMADKVLFHPPDNILRQRGDSAGFGLASAKAYLELSTDDGFTWNTTLTADSGFTSLITDNIRRLIVLRKPGYEIFRSNDAGHSWDSLGTGPDSDPFTTIAFYGKTHLVGTAQSGALYRSTDYGTSWIPILDLAGHQLTVTIQPASDSLFVVADPSGDWLESDDAGGTWRPIKCHYVSKITSLMSLPSGTVITGGTFARKRGGGEPWVLKSSGMSRVLSLAYRSGPQFLAGTASGKNLSGQTYTGTIHNLDTSFIFSDYEFIPPSGAEDDCRSICWARDGTIIAGWGSQLLRSTDGGTLYSRVGPSGPANSWAALAEDSTHTLWAANDSLGLFRSTDAGLTWEASSGGMTTLHVLSLVVVANGDIVAGTTGEGLFRSTDHGITWEPAGLSSDTVQALLAGRESVLYAGTANGVFASTATGASWSDISSGLTITDVHALAQGPDGAVYCGTWGDGVYRLAGDQIEDVAQIPHNVPLTFELEQNYPNPFNPVTRIKYTVGGAGGSGLGSRKTMIVVYDVLGRQAATLVDEVKAPGSYEVLLDGSKLSSGVYFYRMTAGSFMQTRKLLLLK